MPDTIPNRERVKANWFCARADALLDVASRWQTAPTQVSSKASASAEVKLVEVRRDTNDGRKTHAPTATAGAPENPASQDVLGTSAIDLPIERFADEGAQVINNYKDSWSDATNSDFSAFLRLFIAILKENGVHGSKSISQMHIGKFREFLNEIPTRYGQSSRMRAMTPAQLRQESENMLKAASGAKGTGINEEKQGAKVGLSALTIRKHFGNLSTFVQHLRVRGYAIAVIELNGLRPRRPSKASVRKKQYKPNPTDLVQIFKTPIHMGCAGLDNLGKRGPEIYHCALYWVPMFFIYLGARRNEICGLATDDVHLEASQPYISIGPNPARPLKNEQSERDLPIPSEVIRVFRLPVCRPDYRRSLELEPVQSDPDKRL